MRIIERLPRIATEAGARVVGGLRSHPRVTGAAASALAGAAALLVRRRARELPVLPAVDELALSTAVSVHNAAKASVIASVDGDRPENSDLILQAVRAAVEDASTSGVDLTAAALGAVAGSIVVAERLGVTPVDVARAAAREAHAAAARVGFVAAERVEGVLSPLLEGAP